MGGQWAFSFEILYCRSWTFGLDLAPALAAYCWFGCNWE